MSTHLSALRLTEVRTLSTVTRFTHISRQAFSARCCNTSKSFIGSIYTKDFRCPPSQTSRRLRSKDLLGQLTELVEDSQPKFQFRCRPVMRAEWGCARLCISHMCCRWRIGTSAMSTGKLWNENCRQTTSVSLLSSATSPKSCYPKTPNFSSRVLQCYTTQQSNTNIARILECTGVWKYIDRHLSFYFN